MGTNDSLGLSLNADSLGVILALLSSFLCLVSVVVSGSYPSASVHPARYFCSILVLCSALNGIFLSSDMVLLMFFWELMVVSSYMLIVHSGEPSAGAAGRKYFIMTQGAAVLLIVSVAIAFAETGTSDMAGSRISESIARTVFAVMAFLGFAIDAAVVPFHIWLPDAHSESPTPVSALLSGIVVTTGIYGMIRFFHILGPLPEALPGFVVPLGLVTAYVGGFLALSQMDGKRLIAMSTISQVGLILMGIGLGTPQGATGATMHLLNHSLFKALLFLSAGWVMWSAGTRDLALAHSRIGRHARAILPFYAVGLLSISGIPPFNGFYSKSVIAKAVAARFPVLAGLSILVGILTLLSFMKLGWYLFSGSGRAEGDRRAGRAVIAACAILALLCLALGFLHPGVIRAIDAALHPAGETTPAPSALEPTWTAALGYLASMLALGVWVKRREAYALFSKGSLRAIGLLAREEMFFDRLFHGMADLALRAADLLGRMASGNSRDYVAYLLALWVGGMLFVLRGGAG